MGIVYRAMDMSDRMWHWLPLLPRVVVGATFVAHGYGKVFDQGIMETARGFEAMGIPYANVLGPIVPIAEFFGGIFLILGFLTRLWALLNAGSMAFAILFVHFHQGFMAHAVATPRGPMPAGWEWQALLLACCLALAIGGAGRISIDSAIRHRLFPRKAVVPAPEPAEKI